MLRRRGNNRFGMHGIHPFCFYDEHPHFVQEEVSLVHIWKCYVPDVFMVAIYESEMQFKRLIGRYYQCAGGHVFLQSASRAYFKQTPSHASRKI
jgi:hypothetical protein